jgi:hypothetical protein
MKIILKIVNSTFVYNKSHNLYWHYYKVLSCTIRYHNKAYRKHSMEAMQNNYSNYFDEYFLGSR